MFDRYVNNRAENSHQSTRQRERRLQGLKSPGYAQRFLAAYGPIAQHCRPRRHLLPAAKYRQEMPQRFHTWQDLTNLPTAAYGSRLRQSASSCRLLLPIRHKLTMPRLAARRALICGHERCIS